MHEDTQRKTDYERGRDDFRERFHNYDFAELPTPKVHPTPPYSMEDHLRNEEEIAQQMGLRK